MIRKPKSSCQNNLANIRDDLGYTQKQMGEILGVSERMIQKYESNQYNLPIEKAFFLSNEYNYSLDWIYCNRKPYINKEYIPCFQCENNKFVMDIRNFITCSNDLIHIVIPDNYWNYIKKLNKVMSSNISNEEKNREKKKLSKIFLENNNKNWKFSVDINQFCSYLIFDDKETPFVDDNNIKKKKVTKSQIKEAEKFLKELLETDNNE